MAGSERFGDATNFCPLYNHHLVLIPDMDFMMGGRNTGFNPIFMPAYYCSAAFWHQNGVISINDKQSSWAERTPSRNYTLLFFAETLCPILEAPKDGKVHVVGSGPGAIASYSCLFGHELVGDAQRACLESGQWAGSEPVCRGM